MRTTLRSFIGLASVLLGLNAHAVAYWNCSSPTGTASGTWNQDNSTWTTDPAYATPPAPTGGPTDPNPVSWRGLQGGNAAAFGLGTAQNGIPGPYTITVDNSNGQVGTGDILVYTGPVTFVGGKLDFITILNGTPGPTGDAGLVFIIHAGQLAFVNVEMTNSVGPYLHTSASGDVRNVFGNKEGTGSLYLGATNSFLGDIAVKSGILGITCDESIPRGSSLLLLNGSDIGGAADQEADTPPVFNTGGHHQTFHQLVLDGPNSLIPRIIDFHNGEGSLEFTGDTSLNPWLSSASPVYGDSNPGPLTLVITNYVHGKTRLRFGTDATGLTLAQLSQIQFANYQNAPGKIDAAGYVTPDLPVLTRVTQEDTGATLDWLASSSRSYRVESKPSLTDSTWTILVDNLQGQSGTMSYTDITPPDGSAFYRVVAFPRPPIYETSFESTENLLGWSEIVTTGQSQWEIGNPTTGPGSAYDGVNVLATKLAGNYDSNQQVGYRSPVIDLTARESATLEFYTAYDFEVFENDPVDRGNVYVLDATTGQNLLPGDVPMAQFEGTYLKWHRVKYRLPTTALGRPIRIEFRLFSDPVDGRPGWYIDALRVQ